MSVVYLGFCIYVCVLLLVKYIASSFFFSLNLVYSSGDKKQGRINIGEIVFSVMVRMNFGLILRS